MPTPDSLRLHARYRISAATQAAAVVAAEALALEQSVEVPLDAVRDAYVREHVVGRVESVVAAGEGVFDATVSLAIETTGYDVAQTINMLFGNSSLQAAVELIDADFPEKFAQRFGGPRFGIAGLRKLLDVPARPLTCTALKPQGMPPAALAQICHVFAAAGVDVIKDDHGIADQSYSPFAARVSACQREVERAQRETGHRALYAPSLVGSPKALFKQAKILREEGIGAALVAPALIGMPVFHELVAEHLEVPVLAHPSYAGATRVAPAFLLGKLFRLFGADAVIYPHFGGRFAYSERECADIAHASRAAWEGVRPALPVPAGGMTVERVPELLKFYGSDAMLLIGGSLLRAHEHLDTRTREFVRCVVACHDAAALEWNPI